jgi:hypothetical protein
LAPSPEAASEPVRVRTPAPIAAPAQALHDTAAKPAPRGQFLDMVQPTSRPALTPSQTTVIDKPTANPPSPAYVAPSPQGPFMSDVVAPSAAPIRPAPVVAVAPAPEPPITEPVVPIEPTDFFASPADDADPQRATEATPSPFIPDAKVEKRPLGAFGPEVAKQLANDDIHTQLVAVESEDNVVETVEAPAMSHTFAPSPTPYVKPTPIFSAPSAADKKPDHHFSLFEPHEKQPKPAKVPKAVQTPNARVEKTPKYGKGTLIWVTVAIAVMLIGFGVGASLYFLVLQ